MASPAASKYAENVLRVTRFWDLQAQSKTCITFFLASKSPIVMAFTSTEESTSHTISIFYFSLLCRVRYHSGMSGTGLNRTAFPFLPARLGDLLFAVSPKLQAIHICWGARCWVLVGCWLHLVWMSAAALSS